MFFPGGIFALFLNIFPLSFIYMSQLTIQLWLIHTKSHRCGLSLSVSVSQEFQRIHAYEVLQFRWALRTWREQSSLLLHPRGHPLLHYTRAADQRRWTHVVAVPCHCADPLTLTHIYSFSWCYWIQCILNISLFLSSLPFYLHCLQEFGLSGATFSCFTIIPENTLAT